MTSLVLFHFFFLKEMYFQVLAFQCWMYFWSDMKEIWNIFIRFSYNHSVVGYYINKFMDQWIHVMCLVLYLHAHEIWFDSDQTKNQYKYYMNSQQEVGTIMITLHQRRRVKKKNPLLYFIDMSTPSCFSNRYFVIVAFVEVQTVTSLQKEV